MKCPIPDELLVRYWTHDVSDEEAAAIEEHTFGCAACFDASSRMAGLAKTLEDRIRPVATGRDIARAAARGKRVVTNDFQPGVAAEAWFAPDLDLLVHRLVCDLGDVAKVSVEIVQGDGSSLLSFGDVPFDAKDGGILVACQRHFVEWLADLSPPPDFLVRRTHKDGRAAEDRYTILHRLA